MQLEFTEFRIRTYTENEFCQSSWGPPLPKFRLPTVSVVSNVFPQIYNVSSRKVSLILLLTEAETPMIFLNL